MPVSDSAARAMILRHMAVCDERHEQLKGWQAAVLAGHEKLAHRMERMNGRWFKVGATLILGLVSAVVGLVTFVFIQTIT